jgi:polysaccharide chain length determinant protein (PEP-CTERM system associated)
VLPGRQYTLADYGTMAWRRKWVVFVPVVLGLYGALIFSSRLPNIYQSEMLIQVVPQRVPDSYVQSTVTMRTEDRISSLEEQIKSRTELERLIRQMDLYPQERRELPMQDVVEKMRNQILVDVVRPTRTNRETDAFYVRFSYGEPKVAMQVTERLGVLFIEVNQRDRASLAQAADSFLQTQLASSKAKLEEQEQKLELFRERNAGRLPTQMQSNMQAIDNAQRQINQLVEAMARDRDLKLQRERQLGELENEPVIVPPAPAVAGGGAPSAPTATPTGTTAQKIAQLREWMQLAKIKYEDTYPDVVNAKRTLAELEQKLAEETAAAEATAQAAKSGAAAPVVPSIATAVEITKRDRMRQYRTDIESLERQIQFKEAQEQRLRKTVEEYQSRVEQVPGLESEWIALTRDYDTQIAEYKDLLQKSAGAKLAAELEQRQVGEQFRILDAARVPVRPTGVNRLEVNAMGAAIGLGIGVLLAALLELRDKSFRTATDVLHVFKLPVIATVPNLPSETDRRRARWRRGLVSATVAVFVIAGGYGVWALQLWRHIT